MYTGLFALIPYLNDSNKLSVNFFELDWYEPLEFHFVSRMHMRGALLLLLCPLVLNQHFLFCVIFYGRNKSKANKTNETEMNPIPKIHLFHCVLTIFSGTWHISHNPIIFPSSSTFDTWTAEEKKNVQWSIEILITLRCAYKDQIRHLLIVSRLICFTYIYLKAPLIIVIVQAKRENIIFNA